MTDANTDYQSLFQAVLASSSDGLLILDSSRRRILSHNKRFLDLWTIPRSAGEALDTGTLLQGMREKLVDATACDQRIRPSPAHTAADAEHDLALKDGRVLWGRMTPFPNPSAPQGWIWTFTERPYGSQATDAGRSQPGHDAPSDSVAQTPLIRSLFASMSDGFVLQDAAGKVVDFNENALTTLGVTPDQILGKTAADPRWQSVREDLSDYPKNAHPAAVALKTGLSVPPTLIGMRISATSIKWLMVRATPLYTPGAAKPHQVAVTFADVTDIRRTTQELAESQGFLRRITDNLPPMIAYWTPDRLCRFANKAYYEWFGKTQGDMVGISMVDLLGPELYQKNEPYIQRALAGETQQFERKLTKSDGTYGYVWAQYIPDFKDGAVRGIFVLSTDISKLRNMEIRLTERLDVALSAASIGAWSLDLLTDETWRSVNHDRLFGYSVPRAAWHRSDFIDRVVPEDRARVANELAEGLKNAAFRVECRISLAETGEVRRIVTEGQTSFNARGTPAHMIGIVIDVTERRNAEKAVADALELRRTILDGANLAIISTDTAGVIRTYNAGAEKMLGYRADEVIDRLTPAPFHVEQEVIRRAQALTKELMAPVGPGFEVLIAKARATKEPDENDWTYVRKDGSTLAVRLSVTALRGSSGLITGYLGIAQDMSELKSAVAEAAQYHDALDRFAIVAFTDARGVITHANDSFCTIAGYSRQELIGKTHKLINSGLHPASFFQDLWRTITSGKAWRGELCNRRKNGSLYWVDSTILPALSRAGKINGYIAIRMDITDRKRIEAELETSREAALAGASAKSQFLANMSHEIRTPMSGVIGMAQLLLETNLGETQNSYARSILDCGESLLSIVNDVLDFSKIEADKLDLESIPFSITALTASRLDLVAGKVREKNLTLSSIVAANLPDRVAGDPTRIGQVLLNLLSNAIKFTQAGSVVCRVTGVAGPSLAVRFEVEDSGIGLDAAQTSRLFQPFSQADSTMARRFGGTGLGLSICKRLVGLMGGTIGVTSAVGRGSTFWFEVPLGRAPALASAPQWSADIAATSMNVDAGVEDRRAVSRYRILVAEDNAVNQILISKLLGSLGYSFKVVNNGVEALAALAGEPFDLVLMDCQMPDMDGYEATRLIRVRHAGCGGHLPIVALTAHAMKGDLEVCLTAGMDDYLTKPTNRERLARTLDKWLSKGAALPVATDSGPLANAGKAADVKVLADAPPVVDIRRVLESFGGDEDVFREVAAAFMGSAMTTLDVLRTAIANSDGKQIEFQAHKFKSSIGIFLVERGAHLAQTLESKGERGDLNGVPELFEELAKVADRVVQELKRHLRQAA